MFDIKEQLERIPDSPGVYIMRDVNGNVIYVGKAVVLKNRLRQYFQSSKNHTTKVRAMVSKISRFEYIVTDSELEALILECNLIKKFRPRFNVLLKDDKGYPYIKITINEDYPRMLIARKREDDGARYFGPYTNMYAVRQTMETVRKIFPMRTCRRMIQNGRANKRPCLNYHIYQCLAPCQGNVDVESYRSMMNNVCELLEGKQHQIISKLEKEMKEASSKLEFEKAAEIRDKINSLQIIAEKQKVSSNIEGDRDIIAFERDKVDICIEVFTVRKGNLVGRKHFFLENSEDEDTHTLLNSFITQFYEDSPFIPSEIIVRDEVEQANIIQDWLSKKKGSKVIIKVPQKGDKLRLLEMASKNAAIQLDNFKSSLQRKQRIVNNALELLQKNLGLKNKPSRIEAYDISNTGSSEIVASMVVVEDGMLSKNQYRRFKIKSIDYQNDYGAMKEVISRRLKRVKCDNDSSIMENVEFGEKPDLLLVDGGLGHVAVAKAVLDERGIDIPVWGMVKDERHKTKGLVTIGKSIELANEIELLRFITMIQDEAHRFALDYNRRLTTKRYRTSVLDQIEGIGAKRKKALLKHFGSISRIKEATMDELLDVEGLGSKSATEIYNYFH